MHGVICSFVSPHYPFYVKTCNPLLPLSAPLNGAPKRPTPKANS